MKCKPDSLGGRKTRNWLRRMYGLRLGWCELEGMGGEKGGICGGKRYGGRSEGGREEEGRGKEGWERRGMNEGDIFLILKVGSAHHYTGGRRYSQQCTPNHFIACAPEDTFR